MTDQMTEREIVLRNLLAVGPRNGREVLDATAGHQFSEMQRWPDHAGGHGAPVRRTAVRTWVRSETTASVFTFAFTSARSTNASSPRPDSGPAVFDAERNRHQTRVAALATRAMAATEPGLSRRGALRMATTVNLAAFK